MEDITHHPDKFKNPAIRKSFRYYSQRTVNYSILSSLLLPTVTCTSTQYKCPNVEECISKQDLCNGKDDCPGGEDEGYTCCTSSNPCGEGKGHCAHDSVCQSNLKCGKANCNTALGFPSDMDCCYVPGNFAIITLNKTTVACKINQLFPDIIWIIWPQSS